MSLQYCLQASVNRLTEICQLQSAARLQSGSTQTVAGIKSSIKKTDVFAHVLMQGTWRPCSHAETRYVMYVWRNTVARSRNHCCSENATIYFVLIFSHYRINGTIFRKKLLGVKCVFWFCLQFLSKTLLVLRIIQRAIMIYVYRSLRKVSVVFVRF
jgi:hypothetical protein